MGAYEIVVIAVFSMLTIAFVWVGIKSYRQASGQEDQRLRKAARRKALLWMLAGLMFFLSALYVVVRISWIALIVLLIGSLAVGFVIGSGVGANMKQH